MSQVVEEQTKANLFQSEDTESLSQGLLLPFVEPRFCPLW